MSIQKSWTWIKVQDLKFKLSVLLKRLTLGVQPINDLDFHPQMSILISGAKDRTIKYGFHSLYTPYIV